MIVGFIIWSSCAIMIIGVGIWSWNAKKPAGFYAGVAPPKVKDVKKYNHAVAIMWFIYAILFELLGFPFLFQKQNSPMFILIILGVVAITIALLIVYNRILARYRQDS